MYKNIWGTYDKGEGAMAKCASPLKSQRTSKTIGSLRQCAKRTPSGNPGLVRQRSNSFSFRPFVHVLFSKMLMTVFATSMWFSQACEKRSDTSQETPTVRLVSNGSLAFGGIVPGRLWWMCSRVRFQKCTSCLMYVLFLFHGSEKEDSPQKWLC